jgi:hypothetical protein
MMENRITSSHIARMDRLGALWRGELRLSDAFWTWAVLGALVINISTSVLFLVLISADRPLAALVVGYALSVPYNILALVGVWRSAAVHDGLPLHSDLARWCSLILLSILSVT